MTDKNADEEIAKLRILLFLSNYTVGCYTDDGEMQDATQRPVIDYKRDTPDQIKDAWRKRAAAKIMGLEEGKP